MKEKIIFGDNLKHLLKSQGYTYAEFAEKFDLSAQAIGKWVGGENEPSIQNLLKIAQILKVTLDDLILVDLKERARQGKSRANTN